MILWGERRCFYERKSFWNNASQLVCGIALMHGTVGVGELAGSTLTVPIHNSWTTALSDQIAASGFFLNGLPRGNQDLDLSPPSFGRAEQDQSVGKHSLEEQQKPLGLEGNSIHPAVPSAPSGVMEGVEERLK